MQELVKDLTVETIDVEEAKICKEINDKYKRNY